MLIIAQVTVRLQNFNYTFLYTTIYRRHISGLDTLSSSLMLTSSKNYNLGTDCGNRALGTGKAEAPGAEVQAQAGPQSQFQDSLDQYIHFLSKNEKNCLIQQPQEKTNIFVHLPINSPSLPQIQPVSQVLELQS